MSDPTVLTATAAIDSEQRISMTVEHCRWLLMWHGDFMRELTLFEVERDGLKRCRDRSTSRDERRRACLRSIEPGTRDRLKR